MSIYTNIKAKLISDESAEGTLSAEAWVSTIVKIACIFIIGIMIITVVFNSSGLNDTNASFYSLGQTVKDQITSGYSLASLMLLSLGAAAVLHFLGFF